MPSAQLQIIGGIAEKPTVNSKLFIAIILSLQLAIILYDMTKMKQMPLFIYSLLFSFSLYAMSFTITYIYQSLMSEIPLKEQILLPIQSMPAIDQSVDPQAANVSIELPAKVPTCIERASTMVDNITDSLYAEILSGIQGLNRQRSIQKDQEEKSGQKKKSHLVDKPTIDIDLHKKMIRKFMKMNRKSMKSIEQRSVQFEEQARRIKQSQISRRNQEKNKTLELRRERISQRLKSKEVLRQQIQKFVLETNKNYGAVKSKKFLYQQKQEAFKREVILPRLEQQKRILSKLKQKVKPIDMTEILKHQKLYEQKRINDKLNRSLTSRVIQNENFYEPPKFVAKAYLIAEAQEELKKEEQKLKQQEAEINQYRKKEFIKIVQQKQKQEIERQRQLSLQRQRSNKTFSVQTQKIKKQKQKIQLNRQQTKKIGDQYMKQLINLNRSYKAKPAIKDFSSERSIKIKQSRPKSQYQIELIKEERIQKFQKIRLKKIEDILNSKDIDNHFKLQRLQHQHQKFQNLLSAQKESLNKKSEADELASIVLSSIHTKLAILEVSSPKR